MLVLRNHRIRSPWKRSMLQLLSLFLWCSLYLEAFLVVVVSAESRIEVPIDVVLDPNGNNNNNNNNSFVSDLYSRDIKGAGYLNFANLLVSGVAEPGGEEEEDVSNNDNGSIDAVVIFLKTKPTADNNNNNNNSNNNSNNNDDGSYELALEEYIGIPTTKGDDNDNDNDNENPTTTTMAYCCTPQTQSRVMSDGTTHLCELDQIGQLIVNDRHADNIALVQHRLIGAARQTAMDAVVIVDETEHVVLAFGHCGYGEIPQLVVKAVRIEGPVIWVSYTSINTFPLQILLLFLMGGLAVWYQRLMGLHADSRIKVEEWIVRVLWLAAAATALQTVLMVAEVFGDNEPILLEFGSDVVCAVSAVAGRCLYLVLAMGLGVTTLRLSPVTSGFLGLCLGGSLVAKVGAIAFKDFFRNDDVVVLEQLVTVIDYILLVWIPCATCRTMARLERNSEELKLVRYRWILKIYGLCIVLSILEFALFFGDMVTTGGKRFDMESIRESDQIIHGIVLACIAYLWKPNPSQTQYSYVLLEDDDDDNNDHHHHQDPTTTTTTTTNCDEAMGMMDLELTEVVQHEGEEDVVIDNENRLV